MVNECEKLNHDLYLVSMYSRDHNFKLNVEMCKAFAPTAVSHFVKSNVSLTIDGQSIIYNYFPL